MRALPVGLGACSMLTVSETWLFQVGLAPGRVRGTTLRSPKVTIACTGAALARRSVARPRRPCRRASSGPRVIIRAVRAGIGRPKSVISLMLCLVVEPQQLRLLERLGPHPRPVDQRVRVALAGLGVEADVLDRGERRGQEVA